MPPKKDKPAKKPVKKEKIRTEPPDQPIRIPATPGGPRKDPRR